MTTQVERIAAMEVRLAAVEKRVEAMDAKLDELLALRYKGAGAFWLATSLFGISFAGLITMVISWMKS